MIVGIAKAVIDEDDDGEMSINGQYAQRACIVNP